MAELKTIRPMDLLLDQENPRLGRPNEGQRDAMRAIASVQGGRKLVALARDIVESGGLNPTELLIAMPFEDDEYRHIVLEGNRRVVAVKALENPEAVSGAVDSTVLSELRSLSKRYLDNPIEGVPCWVVKGRDDSRHWIELRHTGENDGAGVVKWSSDDVSRFRARNATPAPHFQALNWLESRGDLSPEQRSKVKSTSFKRFLDDKVARERMGVEVVGGEVRLLADEKSVAKLMTQVAKDLATKKIKTRDIYNQADRLKYLEGLPKSLGVTRTLDAGNGTPINASEDDGTSERKESVKKGSPKPNTPRDRLIPRDCTLKVTDARIKAIETELRKLSLKEFTNSVGVLFRVFLELSVDDYVVTKKLAETPDSTLARKLEAAADDLIQRLKLTKYQATPVRRACAKDSFLAPSITLFHKYVHCQQMFPTPSDLRANWDSLQPFITAIWSP